MRSAWRGALIGGIIGIILYTYFGRDCMGYSIRENEIMSSFMTCFGIQGNNCCQISISSFISMSIIFILIPAIISLIIIKLFHFFKK
ncbi:hypothetical protein HYW76_03055 [Candidatus Pacearchaeota archaeon]|nr:hypothetical protein [Candidatus Pacearchaeota archaeon]